MLIKQKALIRGNQKFRIITYTTPCRISLQGILQDIIVSILYDILQGILYGVPQAIYGGVFSIRCSIRSSI